MSSSTNSVAVRGGGQRSMVVAVAKGLAQRPKLASFLLMWLLGFVAFMWAPAPVKVTPEMQAQFEATLAKVPHRELQAAFDVLEEETHRMSMVRVWFWRWRPEYRAQVEALQPQLDKAQARVDSLAAERDRIMDEARAGVGIWSEYGVEEARETFWSAFSGGKAFAKRATWWDFMFNSFRMMGRDESLISFLVGLLFKFLFNLTIGLVGALVSFLFSLGALVSHFSPGFVSGTLFFLVLGVGAASVVLSTLAAVFGSIAGAGYAVVKASANARLENGRARQRLHHYHQQ